MTAHGRGCVEGMPEEPKGEATTVLGEVRPTFRRILLDAYFPEVPDLTNRAVLPGAKIEAAFRSQKTRLFSKFSSSSLRNRLARFNGALHQLSACKRVLEQQDFGVLVPFSKHDRNGLGCSH